MANDAGTGYPLDELPIVSSRLDAAARQQIVDSGDEQALAEFDEATARGVVRLHFVNDSDETLE